ncbi:MAG: chemotaxis response regulator protein-glutamate methylesterase [Planctomycetota bacterium]
MSKRTKVLVVDDSALVRACLDRELGRQPDVEVVGLAPDPFVARDLLLSKQPDVILLDLEMPRMDGLTFLRKIMQYKPTPTIVVSSVTPRGCQTALDCLEIGAFDVLCKPQDAYSVQDLVGDILERVRSIGRHGARIGTPKRSGKIVVPESSGPIATTNKIAAVGTSAGGPEALRILMGAMPQGSPGMVITQHMRGNFLRQMAARLNDQSAMQVCLAEDGMSLLPGRAYIAPEDVHLTVKRSGARYSIHIVNGPLVSGHRPSVDVMFDSVAKAAGANAIGVILTGMGDDGAKGLLAMRKAGARTIAQDEATCTIYGMPARAVEAGAVEQSLPLQDIPRKIFEFGRQAASPAA